MGKPENGSTILVWSSKFDMRSVLTSVSISCYFETVSKGENKRVLTDIELWCRYEPFEFNPRYTVYGIEEFEVTGCNSMNR